MGKVSKFETRAWASTKYELEGILRGESSRAIVSDAEMSTCGWIEVGVAVVELTLRSPEEMNADQIQVIKDQIESERAAHQERINFLQGELQSLLALPNEVTA